MNSSNFYATAHSAALPHLPVKDSLPANWKVYPFCIKLIKIFLGREHFNSPLDGPKQRLHLNLTPRRGGVKRKKP